MGTLREGSGQPCILNDYSNESIKPGPVEVLTGAPQSLGIKRGNS